jgi:hypothetical protein
MNYSLSDGTKVDVGRWRASGAIATEYPFSVEDVYRVYEALITIKKAKADGKSVILISDQINDVKSVLNLAAVTGISPMNIIRGLAETLQVEL